MTLYYEDVILIIISSQLLLYRLLSEAMTINRWLQHYYYIAKWYSWIIWNVGTV